METREIKEKVLRIMALAMDVSTIRKLAKDGSTIGKNPDGKAYPDIFVNFYANVSLFEVLAYEHGYASDREPEKVWHVYLYRNDTPDSFKIDNYFGRDVLDEIISYLEDLKNA